MNGRITMNETRRLKPRTRGDEVSIRTHVRQNAGTHARSSFPMQGDKKRSNIKHVNPHLGNQILLHACMSINNNNSDYMVSNEFGKAAHSLRRARERNRSPSEVKKIPFTQRRRFRYSYPSSLDYFPPNQLQEPTLARPSPLEHPPVVPACIFLSFIGYIIRSTARAAVRTCLPWTRLIWCSVLYWRVHESLTWSCVEVRRIRT